MSDPPRPRPPPVPSLPLSQEPFARAPKSDPPPLPDQLHDTPPPDARRNRSSTPPEGMPLPRRHAEQSQVSPLEEIIREQRVIITHLREIVATAHVAPQSHDSAPPKSRAQIAGKMGLNLGKYGAVAMGVLGLADVVVALWFPEYLGPLGMAKRALGMP